MPTVFYHGEAGYAIMTLRDLNQYRDMLREQAKTERLLESLRSAAEPGAQVITGTPHAPGYQDKLGNLAAKIADLSRELKSVEDRIRRRKPEIVKFVHSISDSQTRLIFHFRFLRGMSWGQIAALIGGGNNAGSVKNTCYRFIKKYQKKII